LLYFFVHAYYTIAPFCNNFIIYWYEINHVYSAHHEILTNGKEIKVGGAVGLLSHNIKIMGQDYNDLYEESYGARVLVGLLTNEGQTCTGNECSFIYDVLFMY
jgi:hypothetical protein